MSHNCPAYREWFLCDLVLEDRPFTLAQNLDAIAAHGCTPLFGREIIRAFGQLELDFYLQCSRPRLELLGRMDAFRSSHFADPCGDWRPERPTIASAAWRLEQAWRLVELGGDHPCEHINALVNATTALIEPLALIERTVRQPAETVFPYRWIPCRNGRSDRISQRFDGVQLNANSLQYHGPQASIDALFRFATLPADDFYVLTAALLMEYGADPAIVSDVHQQAHAMREIDPWVFNYDVIPELVRRLSACRPHRAEAVRTCLVRPLAALYKFGALTPHPEDPARTSVLEQRLRAAMDPEPPTIWIAA